MDEKINQALIQIEKDLQNINAAREQVDTVVKSSAKMKEKVGTFVKEVDGLAKQVGELLKAVSEKENNNLSDFKSGLDSMKEECSKFVKSMEDKSEKITKAVETNLNKSASDFKKHTSANSDSLKTHVEKMHAEIEDLDKLKREFVDASEVVGSLKESMEKLMSELKKSQSSQDKILIDVKDKTSAMSIQQSSIYKELNSLSKQIENETNNISQALDSTYYEIKEAIMEKVGVLQFLVIFQLVLSVVGIILLLLLKL